MKEMGTYKWHYRLVFDNFEEMTIVYEYLSKHHKLDNVSFDDWCINYDLENTLELYSGELYRYHKFSGELEIELSTELSIMIKVPFHQYSYSEELLPENKSPVWDDDGVNDNTKLEVIIEPFGADPLKFKTCA